MVAPDGRHAQVAGPGSGRRGGRAGARTLDRTGAARLPFGIMTTRQSSYAYAYYYATRTAGRGRRRMR